MSDKVNFTRATFDIDSSLVTFYDFDQINSLIRYYNSDYVKIWPEGCYGDPREFGYETIYVYRIKIKNYECRLDTEHTINDLIELFNVHEIKFFRNMVCARYAK